MHAVQSFHVNIVINSVGGNSIKETHQTLQSLTQGSKEMNYLYRQVHNSWPNVEIKIADVTVIQWL